MLTKTNFLLYCACPYEFWMLHQRAASLPQRGLSADEQYIIDQGYEVQALADQLFEKQAGVDFQKEVIVGGLQVKADIFIESPKGNQLIEVKSVSGIREKKGQLKERLKLDLAFQKYVFERAGIPIAHAAFVYVNRDYVYPGGTIQVEDFLKIEEVTEEINAAIPELLPSIEAAQKLMHQKEVPYWDEQSFCGDKLNCSFVRHFYEHRIPAFSIFQLPNLQGKRRSNLLEAGIWDVMEIADNYPLTEKQQLHRQAVQSGQVQINPGAIQQMLGQLRYPLYFLDYEAINPAVPIAQGTSPYRHITFQYSLHIIEAEGQAPIHKDYLANQQEFPSKGLVESLARDIKRDQGTVIVWNQTFEKKRNEDLAERFPDYADFFYQVNERVFDLMFVFSKAHYVHHGFGGSASIKRVLPILAPELDYQQLDISQGMQAAVMWMQSFSDQYTDAARQKVRKDLKAYCKMDTWAMLRIWEELCKLEMA